MAKGDKYIGLTKYLQGSGSDTVELTFSQIGDLVGGLPPAAYRHRAYWSDGSQGSFSYGWLNAGYSLRVQFKDQIAIFTKSDRKPSAMTASSLKKPSIRADSAEQKLPRKANLDIGTAINAIHTYHLSGRDARHTRYTSWDHCYSAFVSCPENPDDEHIEYLCLHLAWYMASWGMLRNSFLMNHDHLIHKPLLSKLLSPAFHSLYCENQSEGSIDLTLEAADVIRSAYPVKPLTDTFITKILLGVFGSSPAYDRFFKGAARKYSICTGRFGEKSLRQLWTYYNDHIAEFELMKKRLSNEGLQYPPMKLIDMCLWRLGYNEANQTKKGAL